MSAAPWLTLVGIGEDGCEGLSRAALGSIVQASLIVGGRRHLALLGPVAAETMGWSSPIEETFPTILTRRPARVVVLASGDPFHFGIGSVLAHHVPIAEIRCHPQPSAFSLACARLGWPQQDCTMLSLCGRPIESLIPALQRGARILVLSADATTPIRVAELLRINGLDAAVLTVLEAMGGPRERIRTTTAGAFALDAIDPLNMIAIDIPADAEGLSLVPGRRDDLFDNDGQITKSDIRAVTLAQLAPHPGEVLWDIGAGSGSVAIEWLLASTTGRAVAVERDPSRAARIRRNAAALGVPGLIIVEGRAPEALAGLLPPDAIFVGGGATTPGLLGRCREAMSPRGRLVVNAVTIETQALLIEAYRQHGGALSTLAVAHADAVGGFHGWRPAMPVTQWIWVKP